MPYNVALADTFQIIHQALQFIAITGKSLLPPRFDDSHTTCLYDFNTNHFVGEWMHFGKSMRLELDPVELKLHLVAYGSNLLSTLSLHNKTKKEVYGQLRLMLSNADISVTRFSTDMHYDMPDHEVCKGGKYKIHDPELNREISRYYHNSYLLLNIFKGKLPQAGDIRIWPHHFDITLDSEVEEKGDNLGNILTIGFAPSNFLVAQPYFFVALKYRPCRNVKSLPKLHYGKWFAKEWFGTHLCLSEVLNSGDNDKQPDLLYRFINESVDSVFKV